MRIALVALLSLAFTVLPQSTLPYQADFLGRPVEPTPWQPTAWDITVSAGPDGRIDRMDAHHGPDCSPHPATHSIEWAVDSVYQCNDHIMTAMSAGYGAVYMTPNVMLDWSAGEAVLRWRMSTLRSASRDWVDVTLMPFETNYQLAFQDRHARPPRAIHLNLEGGGNVFKPFVYTDGASRVLPYQWFNREWQRYVTPSGTTRSLFEVRVSKTNLFMGMPEVGLVWINTPISPPLDWDQAVIQFNHRSYNPDKSCNFNGSCAANTWHWSNVEVSPAVPFTIIPGARFLPDGGQVDFPAPAPEGAFLRYAGNPHPIRYSLDGQTWLTAQTQDEPAPPEHGTQYFTSIPAGTQTVWLSGPSIGVAIWARTQGEPIPTPVSSPSPAFTPTTVATLAPTATPLPSPTPTLTPEPTPTVVPTATATPAPSCELYARVDEVDTLLPCSEFR